LTDAELRASSVPVLDQSVLDIINDLYNITAPARIGMPTQDGMYVPILPVPAFSYRCGFDRAYANNVDPDFLTLVRTGTGQTINQTGGNLVITAGTTANAETIARSVNPFSGNLIWRWNTTLSQRIAQNNFFVELVDVIGDNLAYTINSSTSVTVVIPGTTWTSANVGQSVYLGNITGAAGLPNRYAIASVSGTSVTFTVASWPATGSGTLSLFGWNYHQITYQGTTATSADFDCQRRGYASGVTAATINTTASGHVGTISVSDGEAAFADQTGASATGIEITRRASRVRNVPLNETELYLQIRCRNGTTNPASGTTWTIGFVDIGNCSTLPVTIQNVSMMSANSGLPCTLESSITQNVSLTTALPGGSNNIGMVSAAATASAAGATPIATTVAASNVVLKASAGNLYSVNICTGAVSGYLMLFNATSAPADGTVTPTKVLPVAANAGIILDFATPLRFTTGCTAVFSTTGPFTKTASATAFISGECI
jgi:hypothetical protein